MSPDVAVEMLEMAIVENPSVPYVGAMSVEVTNSYAVVDSPLQIEEV
jgi:hypothetical protein